MHILWVCGIFQCYFQLHFHSSNSKLELRDASSILWCGIVPLLHTVPSQACCPFLLLPLGLAASLIYVPLCCPAEHYTRFPTPYSLHTTPCTPCTACTLLALFISILCLLLRITATLLRLFGRLSVCSTLQQCHCSMVWYSIHVIPNISLYVLHIYAHLRGVLCS